MTSSTDAPTTGHRLFIARDDLHRVRIGPDPDAPAARALQDGELRVAVERFALTANNITYAAFGEAMRYWQFYPAPDAAWGCLPVWGFAVVSESRVDGIAPGRRLYGYWPAGTHAVLRPAKLRAGGFVDASPHRAELAAAYQQVRFVEADPGWQPGLEAEGLQAVLQPLFFTAFLIDDFLAQNGFFGARQLLLSSASSKTAYATAFCLAQRRGQPGLPRTVGLTSAARLGFARSLGCYDALQDYTALAAMDASVPTVYIDFAGNAALRRAVHTHFGDALAYSSSIGGTHWEALGSGRDLPGPRPVLFFAPALMKARSAPPPEGWGPEGFAARLGAAWAAFTAAARQGPEPWVRITERRGAERVREAYLEVLDGRADAREGLMLGF